MYTNIVYIQSTNSFLAVDENGKMSKIDCRTQDEIDYDEAMIEIDNYLGILI